MARVAFTNCWRFGLWQSSGSPSIKALLTIRARVASVFISSRSQRLVRALVVFCLATVEASSANDDGTVLGPGSIAVSSKQPRAYLACQQANRVIEADLQSGDVLRRFPMPGTPLGLAISHDDRFLWVTIGPPQNQVSQLELESGSNTASIPVGHTPLSPVSSPDNRMLYVGNRFDNSISVIQLAEARETDRIPVLREPVALALTPNGKHLVAVNSLHEGRSDTHQVSAAVTVIDTGSRRVVRHIRLPNGSSQLLGVCVSPDGHYAAVTHLLARFHLPASQVERGWMNSNAFSLIDLTRFEWVDTFLLDGIDLGAANPWAIAWTGDNQFLVVSHAGTHELSFIDMPAFWRKWSEKRQVAANSTSQAHTNDVSSAVYDDLSFLVGLRTRISLPGLGPRSMAMTPDRIWVAHYFSDSIAGVRLNPTNSDTRSWRLSPEKPLSRVRRGELLFNDGRLCFQGWQSCASCHSEDGRVDGLNWDLLNDGIGNPKNAKSMLLAHQTPPTMSIGIRESAEIAVRAGIRNVLFTQPNEPDADAIDAFLKSLQPLPSPHLKNGQLSDAAKRGQQLFRDPTTGCSACHPPGLYTDTQLHDVGTTSAWDGGIKEFDTPTLVEIWRTAPFLHDGSAADLHEVFTARNPHDKHGKTSHLSPKQLDDLVQFLLSI